MTSSRPYLVRALYDWIVDNGMTPYLLVNAEKEHVIVPQEHVHEGRIVLNINPAAVHNLELGNHIIEFSARFGGVEYFVQVPPYAILAIYAKENGQGMAFADEMEDGGNGGGDSGPPEGPKPGGRKKPQLKVVK